MPILHWLDRDKHTKAAEQVPYRLLEADEGQSFGDPDTGNMLIQGDNLEALKSLLPYYAGRVKCIYIDPPYNTLSANFEHYDDNLEHSQWLAMIFPRLQLLRDFLAEDGSLWVSIDDNEAHYMKVVMDEVFGRKKFGDEGYAREELVAELGAAFLCATLSITPEPREDHAQYLASWLTVLKEDKRAIFSAASHAQRAVDWLYETTTHRTPG